MRGFFSRKPGPEIGLGCPSCGSTGGCKCTREQQVVGARATREISEAVKGFKEGEERRKAGERKTIFSDNEDGTICLDRDEGAR